MLDCASFNEIASRISVVRSCQALANGILRVTTTFQYPDGSYVDLFFRERSDNFLNSLVLTDMGETTAYLLELNIRPWKTAKRKQIISRICHTLGVEQSGAELLINVAQYERTAEQIGPAIIRLAQACLRVSDISLTYSLRSVSAFREEVEEFLDGLGYRYETDVKIPGQLGKDVVIDFSVEGPNRISLVHTMSAANSIVARHVADDVFTRWYDIRHVRSGRNCVTVYDGSTNAFAETDIQRIGDFSTSLAFPDEQESIAAMLKAA
jgi:hypothetical protein